MDNIEVIKRYVYCLGIEGLTESEHQFQGRCPICGDSKSKKNKRRFYIIWDDEKCTCVCHNCSLGSGPKSFHNFLKEYFNIYYQEYKKEVFLSKIKRNKNVQTTVNFQSLKSSKSSKKISNNKRLLIDFKKVENNNYVLGYCENRKIPENYLKKLYYSDNFMKWLNDNKLREFKYVPKKDLRIILPFIQNKEVTHLQARAIYKTDLRYLTATIKEEKTKVFNFDNINKNNDLIFIIEGPFDSMFIENSISFGSQNVNFDFLNKKLTEFKKIMCFDTDIRTNENLRKTAMNYISNGLGIVFWPKKYQKYKDINEMIIAGISQNEIYNTLKKNHYFGLKAKLKLKTLK